MYLYRLSLTILYVADKKNPYANKLCNTKYSCVLNKATPIKNKPVIIFSLNIKLKDIINRLYVNMFVATVP